MLSFKTFMCSILVSLCQASGSYWVENTEAQLLTPSSMNNVPEKHVTDVWKSCECDTSYCFCKTEFHGWNDKSLNFNIHNDSGRFKMEVFDTKQTNKITFHLKEGYNCHVLKADVFDLFCIKPYANITNTKWINICLQMGLILETTHAISLEYQCFRSDQLTFNHTAARFETPDLEDFNSRMFDYYISTSGQINYKSNIMYIIVFLVVVIVI